MRFRFFEVDGVPVRLWQGDLNPEFITIRDVIFFDFETSPCDFSGPWWETVEPRVLTLYSSGAGVVDVVGDLQRGRVPEGIKALLERNAVWVAHNAAFDLRVMESAWGIKPSHTRCTKIWAKAIYPGRKSYSLESIARWLLRERSWKDDKVRLGGFRWPLSEKELVYAVRDVLVLARLYQVLEREIDSRLIEF